MIIILLFLAIPAIVWVWMSVEEKNHSEPAKKRVVFRELDKKDSV